MLQLHVDALHAAASVLRINHAHFTRCSLLLEPPRSAAATRVQHCLQRHSLLISVFVTISDAALHNLRRRRHRAPHHRAKLSTPGYGHSFGGPPYVEPAHRRMAHATVTDTPTEPRASYPHRSAHAGCRERPPLHISQVLIRGRQTCLRRQAAGSGRQFQGVNRHFDEQKQLP